MALTSLIARICGVLGVLAAVGATATWLLAPELPGLRTLTLMAAVGLGSWLYLDWPAIRRFLASRGGVESARAVLIVILRADRRPSARPGAHYLGVLPVVRHVVLGARCVRRRCIGGQQRACTRIQRVAQQRQRSEVSRCRHRYSSSNTPTTSTVFMDTHPFQCSSSYQVRR